MKTKEPAARTFGMNVRVLHCLLIGVLVLGAYANSIQNGFVWDDIQLIKGNPDIRQFGNIFKVLGSEDAAPGTKTNYYRPVTYLSFMADYAIWNGSPRGFHSVNILLHLCFACLLYLFISEILASSQAALTGAALFALHPVATETVNFIAGGRNTLLCGVFLLAALLAHRKGRPVLALLLMTLSVFSKEFGLLFPAVAALADRYFPRDGYDRRNNRTAFALYAAVILFYLIVRAYVLKGSGFDIQVASLPWKLLFIPEIVFTYLKVILIPYPLTTPYHLSIPEGISLHAVLYAFMLMAGLFAAYRFRRFTVFYFSLLWFLIFLLPVLNLVPIGPIVAAERYIYIAMAGFAVLLGAGAGKMRKPPADAVFICIGLLFFILVVNRNPVWRSDYTLFSDAVKKSPGSPIVRNNLGLAYAEQGRFDEAIEEYQAALKLAPDFFEAYYNLGNVYKAQGDIAQAMEQYQSTLRVKPDHVAARDNLGILYGLQNKAGDAIRQRQIALAIDPDNVNVRLNLGADYAAQGRTDDAIREFQAVLRQDPGNVKAHYNLGLAYVDKGMSDKATNEFRAALAVSPDFVPARHMLDFLSKK